MSNNLHNLVNTYYECQSQLKELGLQSKTIRKQIKDLSERIIETMNKPI